MTTDHCPICEASASPSEELPETAQTPGRYREIDVGCTEPLCGYLCDSCARVDREEVARG